MTLTYLLVFIIVKKSEHSGTKVVRNLEDVESLALGSLN